MKKLELQSERLSLRLLVSTDLAFVHSLHALPATDRFNTLGIPENIEKTREVIAPWIAAHDKSTIRNYTFVIQHTQTSKYVGLFGLKLGSPKFHRGEVWYKIHPECWRQGYATESLNLVLDYGFNSLQLHRIQAGCAVDNLGSIKVLEKVGMIREGRGRQVLPLSSGWSDNFEYSILETDVRKK